MEETLMQGKIDGKRKRGWLRMRQLDNITDSADTFHEFEHSLGEGEGQGSLMCCSSWGSKELDMT